MSQDAELIRAAGSLTPQDLLAIKSLVTAMPSPLWTIGASVAGGLIALAGSYFVARHTSSSKRRDEVMCALRDECLVFFDLIHRVIRKNNKIRLGEQNLLPSYFEDLADLRRMTFHFMLLCPPSLKKAAHALKDFAESLPTDRLEHYQDDPNIGIYGENFGKACTEYHDAMVNFFKDYLPYSGPYFMNPASSPSQTAEVPIKNPG